MKVIIELELEIDGKWKASYRDQLLDLVMANPGHGIFEINDNCVVLVESGSFRLAKSRKAK